MAKIYKYIAYVTFLTILEGPAVMPFCYVHIGLVFYYIRYSIHLKVDAT